MSKRMVHCYYTYETISILAIGYMINPYLNYNILSRVQVEKNLMFQFILLQWKLFDIFEKEEYMCYGTNNDL